MTPPVRLGVLGCGRAGGGLHLPALARVAELRVVALADTSAEALEAAGRRLPAARRYGDPDALLGDAEVEAVLVALPAELHARWGEAVLDSGRHLFVEKPLALSVESGARLVAAAARSSRVAAVGYNLRQHRLVAAARARVAAGALGALEGVRVAWTTDLARRAAIPPWRARRASGGGVLWELGSHHWDLVPFLTGRAVVEVAALAAPRGEVETPREDDAAGVALRLDGGAVATCFFAQAAGVRHEIVLEGSARCVELDLYRFDGFHERRAGVLPGALRDRLGRGLAAAAAVAAAWRERGAGGGFLASYGESWRRFAAAVRSGAPSPCPLDDGLRALRVAEAVARSLAERRAVEIAVA